MSARTPEEVDRQFGERVNAGDVDGIVALYEKGATLLTQDAGPLIGHQAIREYLGPLMTMKAKIRMGVQKVVQVGDIAAIYNDWHLTATTPDGQKMEMSGKATEIVRRQPDGTWLFVLDDPNMRG